MPKVPTPGLTAFMIRIIEPAIRAAIDPTDRSMPPEMITKVAPTAMMPIKAARVSTLDRLETVRKSGLSSVATIIRAARPSKGPRLPRRARAEGRGVTWASPGWVVTRAPEWDGVVRAGGDFQAGGVLNDFLLVDGLAAQFADDAALAHHQQALAEAQQFVEFAGNDDDGLAALGQRARSAGKSRAWPPHPRRAWVRRARSPAGRLPECGPGPAFADCRPRAAALPRPAVRCGCRSPGRPAPAPAAPRRCRAAAGRSAARWSGSGWGAG